MCYGHLLNVLQGPGRCPPHGTIQLRMPPVLGVEILPQPQAVNNTSATISAEVFKISPKVLKYTPRPVSHGYL